MAARKGWDELSAPYRASLIRAGVTRSTYRTADLRRARGHGPKAPKTQAPRPLLVRAAQGQSRPSDRRALEAWRRGRNFPKWLPRSPADMDNTTAAILSTITPAPNARDRLGRKAGWKSVTFIWGRQPSEPVTVRIKPIRGYAFSIELPDQQAAIDFLRWIRANPSIFGAIDFEQNYGQRAA